MRQGLARVPRRDRSGGACGAGRVYVASSSHARRGIPRAGFARNVVGKLGCVDLRENGGNDPGGVAQESNPLWHEVGRVTFHLAENKRDPERPFAFLATYTHRLSEQGKAQHLPMARALQEYAGAKDKARWRICFCPFSVRAEKSGLARDLIEFAPAVSAAGLDAARNPSFFAVTSPSSRKAG